MRPYLLFSLLLLLACPLSAQLFPDNPRNEDRVYDDYLRTVKLHLAGAPLTLPAVDLRAAGGTLVLSFDRLGADIFDYEYKLIHCNSDWQPSELENHEYINGFTEDRITQYENSFNTLVQYVHYSLRLPNNNMRWTQSGNYLLVVYDTDDPDRQPVLVRRFMVVEQSWRISAQFTRPSIASKFNTHHEIDFTVRHPGTRVPNPQSDVKAFVLQNGRWDNAIGPVKPYIARDEEVVYDYQDKIVFPAGKEWRLFDMRTYDYRGERVAQIAEYNDGYVVTVKPDESRAGHSYIYQGDINGRYSIDNLNANQSLMQCDYADVVFTFQQKQPFENDDLYLFGEITDWQLKPEYRLQWNAEAGVYATQALLKQGYYNYGYLLVDRATGAVDEEGVEGNWYETGNQYTVLVYFRPFGARFDRLMAVTSVDSRRRD
jgi:hypothetical protein